jgi:hypothetical protein
VLIHQTVFVHWPMPALMLSQLERLCLMDRFHPTRARSAPSAVMFWRRAEPEICEK